MNTLLIFFLVLWVLVLLRAVLRGFVRTLISIILLLLFVGMVRLAVPPVTASLGQNERVQTWAVEKSKDFVRRRFTENAESEPGGGLWSVILPIPKETQQIMEEDPTGLAAEALQSDEVIDPLAEQLAKPLIKVTGLIAAVLLCLILIIIINVFIRYLARNREYRGVDHLLGILPGFVKAAFYSWAILTVLRLAGSAGLGKELLFMIEKSSFLTILDSTNPFIKLF